MDKEVRVLVFGDICPTKDTLPLFLTEEPEKLFNDVLPLIRESDIVVGNLECVLTDHPHPIKKAGPVLYAPVDCIKILEKSGFSALSLANNHVRDCGSQGIESTIQACDNAEIKWFGVGKSQEEAKKPLIFECKGLKIGIISFAEHEFNVAPDGNWTSNFFDPYTDLEKIRSLKTETDYVIVLYHGGIEYHPYPSPELMKKCRAMVRFGADLVSCQHSHCIGTIEEYKGSQIVYGQGNSIFGYRKNNDSWNQGLLLSLSMSSGKLNLQLVNASEIGISKVNPTAESHRLNQLRHDSSILKDAKVIRSYWEEFCAKKKSMVLPQLYGKGLWFNRVNRLAKNMLIKALYSKQAKRITLNLLRCDAHKEVVQTILNED